MQEWQRGSHVPPLEYNEANAGSMDITIVQSLHSILLLYLFSGTATHSRCRLHTLALEYITSFIG